MPKTNPDTPAESESESIEIFRGEVVAGASMAGEAESAQRARLADRLARVLEITGQGLRALVFAIAATAALIGVLAMVVGIIAWRHADQWHLPLGVIVVTLFCLPAVALPFGVHRRLDPITRAVEHPEALARQAVDYVGEIRSGTELGDLLSIAGGGRVRIWRIRTLWQATSLIGAFTSRITPDPERQPLVSAFMPVNLKTLWLALIVTAWALVVAVVVLLFSAVAMLAGWTPVD